VLVRVESRRFIAGLTVEDGVVKLAAPILRRIRYGGAFYHPVGRPWDEVAEVIRNKGWEIRIVEKPGPR